MSLGLRLLPVPYTGSPFALHNGQQMMIDRDSRRTAQGNDASVPRTHCHGSGRPSDWPTGPAVSFDFLMSPIMRVSWL
jgi:hypothetical protein